MRPIDRAAAAGEDARMTEHDRINEACARRLLAEPGIDPDTLAPLRPVNACADAEPLEPRPARRAVARHPGA